MWYIISNFFKLNDLEKVKRGFKNSETKQRPYEQKSNKYTVNANLRS